MAGFREEIRILADPESPDRDSNLYPYRNFNADELTEADRVTWEKLKAETLTEEEFTEWRRAVGNETVSTEVSSSAGMMSIASRELFSDLVANRFAVLDQKRKHPNYFTSDAA